MKDIELVIFDMDGLMIDSESLWMKAWENAGKKLGYNFDKEFFFTLVGISGDKCYSNISNRVNYEIEPQLVLEEARRQMKIIEENKKIETKPGLYDLLDIIDEIGLKKAIATSTNREKVKKILGSLDLYNRFDYIICGDEVTNVKPDPEIYLNVLNYFNVSPKKVLILEDSKYGVEAAYRSNSNCIMIPDLIQPTEIEKSRVKYIMDSLLDVKELLSQSIEVDSVK